MSKDDFHTRMVSLLRRGPFVPFVVELAHGERLLVERPEMIARNGGAAVFCTPAGELILVDSTNTLRLGSDVASALA